MSAVSLFAASLAALTLVAIACIMLLEIVLRTVFHTSTFMAAELVGYGVAVMSFLALAHSFERGAQIRVGVLPNLLRKFPCARVMLEVACCLFTLFIVGLAVGAFGYNVLRQFERGYWSGTMSQMPQWVPQGLVLVGLALAFLQILAYLANVISTRRVMDSDNSVD